MNFTVQDMDTFFNNTIKFKNKYQDVGDFIFEKNINLADNTKIYYWAANPCHYNSSYSGSGLPYLNPKIAFETTPNYGITKVKKGKIKIHLYFPSSFYCNMGNILIEPSIFLRIGSFKNKTHVINLKNAVPYRKCVNSRYVPDNFLNKNLSQEAILRNRGYPSKNIDT